MKTALSFLTATLLAATATFAMDSQTEREVNKLLAKLSLDEKIGQMVQLDLMTVTRTGVSPIQLDPEKLREAVVTHKVGSFINNGLGRALSVAEWTYVLKTIQDMILNETPNKIPLLYGIDSIHGATYIQDSTLFPQAIAMAATRNPELMRLSAEISAKETRAAGLRWTFAPVLDVGRQPLWARFPETFGEDPYLASVFGIASIHGFEGSDVGAPISVASCMKHYMGYSFPLNGKDRSPTLVSDPYLREYFLPPFRAAVKAGARTVMIDSGEVNGVPVHGSKYLLTDVLRGELGFKGVIVSDWEDVIRLHTWHNVAETPAEAVRMAVDAGLDISMVPMDFSFFKLLKQLVQEGKISEKRIDQSVKRILLLKADVGLMRNPYVEPETANQFGRPEYRQTAITAAEEALTLLKNEGALLPLSKSAKVFVTGPAAKSLSALHGCWSYTWQGLDEKQYPKSTLTIVEAIRQKLGEASVTFQPGVSFDGKISDIDAAVSAAGAADAIVLCLGEDAYAETPGDINDFNLPAAQQELAKRLYATGKPVVLVLLEGRGRIIREIEPDAKAILMAYWPGSGGAPAIANVLFGDTNPSGKLPFTYARHANHLLTYDRNRTARINELEPPAGQHASDFMPQWEFGTGLSYTTFKTENLKLSTPVLKGSSRLTITVDVTNTGKLAGKETVELYTRDVFASTTPPLKRLRAFEKIVLEPGQTRTVSFPIAASDLAFVNAASKLVTEPGDFEVMVGELKAKFRFEK
ncbi:MAG: glycoside hydrolase family 3 C-terminal domain-containing protein [Akkermansiaceae bacterium]|nr:glycoside hydrolase family 3 C-terminal domain-containing protein [Verrucomicrobiales bacterium]